jgi:hypothetical protein
MVPGRAISRMRRRGGTRGLSHHSSPGKRR